MDESPRARVGRQARERVAGRGAVSFQSARWLAISTQACAAPSPAQGVNAVTRAWYYRIIRRLPLEQMLRTRDRHARDGQVCMTFELQFASALDQLVRVRNRACGAREQFLGAGIPSHR